MNVNPSDIPDENVRNWYMKKKDQDPVLNNIDVVDIEQFKYIFDDESKIRQQFFKGHEEYHDSKKLDMHNSYWQHLISVAKSPFITSHYQCMSHEEIEELILKRFALVGKIKHGFDSRYPIRLFPLKYSKYSPYTKNVTTKKNKRIYYEALDGYHRIMISQYHGRTEIPVQIAHLKLNGHSPASIIEHMKKTDNWYQPIDFGYKNNFNLFHFQNKNDNLHGIGKYKFSLQKHLGDLENQIVIDLGCNSGVITAAIARSNPKLVVGIDRKEQIKNALYVMGLLWKDYANLSFQILDLSNMSLFRDLCTSIQPIDCILACNTIYYLGDHIDDVIDICAKFSPKIILQGNTLKLENGKRVIRMNDDSSYRGEYSQIEPMKNLLVKHGYRVHIDTCANGDRPYNKPVVVGTR